MSVPKSRREEPLGVPHPSLLIHGRARPRHGPGAPPLTCVDSARWLSSFVTARRRLTAWRRHDLGAERRGRASVPRVRPTSGGLIFSLFGRVGSCVGVLGVVMRFCRLMTTDDLARWEPWGIPSTWRSPTTWGSGGSPRRDRQRPHVALPPGPHVVALGEVGGMPHPVHTGPAPPALVAGHPGGLPARRGHVLFGPYCVWRCSAAGRTLTQGFGGREGR